MKNRPNRRGKPLEGDRGRAEHARRQQQEEARSTTRSRTPSDAVSMVRTATLAANFDNTCETRSMDEREAFWAAVYKFRPPEWNSAFPDQPGESRGGPIRERGRKLLFN
jgi:hypothetical protein